jgi:hypothetical protein
MPITLSGTKYSETVTSYASRQVTASGATFLSTDFSTPRIIALFDSGNAFKGISYIRRFINATVLEMEMDFFDPATNQTVALVAGDVFDVSLNLSEVATTGLSVSGALVEVTDQVSFGNDNDVRSLCLYDEEKNIDAIGGGFFGRGGVVVFGHLISTETLDAYAPVNFRFTASGTRWRTLTSSFHCALYGGSVVAQATPAYFGGYQGASGGTMLCSGTNFTQMDLISVGAGDSWGSTADRHILRNISHFISKNNAIAVRWGDGVIEGGNFKMSGAIALGVFGASSNRDYAIGAAPDERLVVSEAGDGTSAKTNLFRCYPAITTDLQFDNVITANRRISAGGTTANPNATASFKFTDSYKNAVSGTEIVIVDQSGTEVDRGTANGTDGLPLTITEATIAGGENETVVESNWKFGAFAYEKSIVSGTFSTENYDTIGGVAKNVSHGTTLLQSDDPLVSDTRSNVQAYPITVSLVGTTLTITGDGATLQSLTAAQMYDAAKDYLGLNYAAEDETLITRVGDRIDCRALNLVLDYITFTGSVTTTGAVTLNNGSTVSGTITDSTADSALTFSGVDGWIVYANATDQDANTNALGSGTTGNYRFTYVASTTYYMRLTSGTDTIFKTVTPTASGETAVELTTAGLLTTLSGTVSSIDTQLGFVPPIVFCDPSLATNGDGSGGSPYNSLADAVTRAGTSGAVEIDLEASGTLSASAAGVNIRGVKESLALGLNGQDITGSKFTKLLLYGSCVTTGSQFEQCYIGFPGLGGVSGFDGLVQGFILKNTLSLAGNTTIVNGGTEHGEDHTIQVNAGNSLSMTQISGNITLSNIVAGSMADINFDSGHLTIDSSCTSGSVRVRGNATVTDNSAGTTVTDETINNLSSADVTAAIPSEIDANIIKVNNVTIDGVGTKENPFGP